MLHSQTLNGKSDALRHFRLSQSEGINNCNFRVCFVIVITVWSQFAEVWLLSRLLIGWKYVSLTEACDLV